MRRYQLSGLEHVHMMRHVPRSYDMTRTHILHKSVNKHVDVVLRCSPKNWKKKKVSVTVVRGQKKNDAARIRANAKKGYVAVRKANNDQFEAERRAAAAAYETVYGKRRAGSDALIHDMKSQISTMAKKSADYIDNQLGENQENAFAVLPQINDAAEKDENGTALISPESEKILRDGGYRLPGDRLYPSDPYAADYLKQASDEEFHILMDSLEKSLDEACKKYATQPEIPEAETDSGIEKNSGFYTDYTGSYNLPNNVSLSVTQKQEVKTDKKAEDEKQTARDITEEFKPALSFTDGGEQYIPEDGLFDRELHRPGYSEETEENSGYVPPAYFFDDDDSASYSDGSEPVFVMPEPVPADEQPKPQDIFYTAEDDDKGFFDVVPADEKEQDVPFFMSEPEKEESEVPFFMSEPEDEQEEKASAGYPQEDYEQQQVFFTTHPEDEAAERLYNPPEKKEDFAQPTMYPDSVETPVGDEEEYGPSMVFPDMGSRGDQPAPENTDDAVPSDEPQDNQPSQTNMPDDDDLPPPMIFPDDEEDLPPPMIFPDDDEEGYSPAPVSPDRNEYFESGGENQGVVDRSGQTLFSRSGDQIKKVIGVIRGSGDSSARSKRISEPVRNQDVEITYSDRGRFGK